jgi:hypothetical protein
MFTLIGGKKMHHHITEIHDEPAVLRTPFHPAFLFVLLFGRLQHPFGKRIQHAVAGTVANHKIIGKGGDILDVEQQDVFALLILQGVDDRMGKFECVQVSPLHDVTDPGH